MDVEKPEPGLLHTCRELGIAHGGLLVPLAGGMLTGRYESIDEFFDENDFSQVDSPVL